MSLVIDTDPRIDPSFNNYPEAVRAKLKTLRSIIIEAAVELDIPVLEETLKWGEPSYLAKGGSTIRMDWKSKSPDQYALYFKCTSKLVPTFREVFGNTFNYEGNRAILFRLDSDIPVNEVKKCVAAALRYHSIKAQDQLGMSA